MCDRCRVDDPPMNRFTCFVSETLGFRPGLAGHAHYKTFAAGAFVPVHDNEDAIALSRAERVDNERPGEQSFLTLTFLWGVEVSAGSGRPVHIRTGFACIELHFTGFSNVYLYDLVAGGGMGMQPMDLCRQRKKIANAGVNSRALWDSKKRTRTVGWFSLFRERVDVLVHAVWCFRIPTGLAKLEAQNQDAVFENPGGCTVVVG